MKNRSLTLLMTASLGLASVPGALAQSTPAPTTSTASSTQSADPRLAAANVSLEIGTYSGPLSSLLAAVAKSAGYDVIFDTDVDGLSAASSASTATAPATTAGTGTATTPTATTKPVVYNFRNTPFNQVWPLLMDIYGLSYEVVQVGPTQVLRISTRAAQTQITLKNADAKTVVDQVKLFFGTPLYSENPQKDSSGNVVAVNRFLVDVKIDSPTLKIIADEKTNSLIVRGTNSEIAQVQMVVASIDSQQRAGNGYITVYPKASIDNIQSFIKAVFPDLTVTTLTNPLRAVITGGNNRLLDLSNQLQQQGLIYNSQEFASANNGQAQKQAIYAVKGSQTAIVSTIKSVFPTLNITEVGSTGQIVLNGRQIDIDDALKLLAEVDKAPAAPASGPTIVQKVFTLTNASAEELKTVLDGTLQRTLGTTTGLVGGGAPVTQADGTTVIQLPGTTGSTATGTASGTASTQASTPQATIIADKRTNTIIVRGTQAQVDQIAQIIPSLDVRVPQVNVQVRIQEITESASRSLGVDWKAGFGNFIVNVASSGVKAIFDPTQSLVGFNLGATLNALEQQGMTKRVYDGTVTMQSGQRSLNNSTDSQNASSGAAAHLQSGGRLELNIPSQAANVPAIQRQIDYGVTIDFYNPQVAPDGSITVRVKGVVNQPKTAITGSTLPNLLDFSNSEAQTTITFKSGETVLLSGLLGTNQTTTTTGLPFLSSIPVIGSLFGKQSTTNDRSQLLVVITGTVVQ